MDVRVYVRANIRGTGIVLASSGNFSAAATFICKQMGIPCTVVFPLNTYPSQIRTAEKNSATIMLHGMWCGVTAGLLPSVQQMHSTETGGVRVGVCEILCAGDTFEAAHVHAQQVSTKQGSLLLSGHSDPSVCAGFGTMALEMLQQNPYLDAVLVPVGAGTLLAATAVVLKHVNPRIQIYGVETTNAPLLTQFLQTKSSASAASSHSSSSAAGSASPDVGMTCQDILRNHLTDVLLVDESEVRTSVCC